MIHDLVHVYLQDASIKQWLKEHALGSGRPGFKPGQLLTVYITLPKLLNHSESSFSYL